MCSHTDEKVYSNGRCAGCARDCNKRYEKTKAGFLMRLYRNMQSRTEGIQPRGRHRYIGKELLPRVDFYLWALNSPEFHELFAAYQASGHRRRLAPSVNRVDSSKGYRLDNMEWVTHSENSRLGGIARHRKAVA